MLPVLYSFRRCPYAMRARLALLYSGQACELREVVLRDKPEALRIASAKATVPVLIDTDGTVIDQSLDIMLWALQRNDPCAWLAPSQGNLPQMLVLIAMCDNDFKPQLDRYKYPGRYPATNAFASQVAGAAFLMQLQQRLEASPYLFGVHATLADMAVAPFVRQFAAVDTAWFAAQPWPALRAWLAAWQDSALFGQAMRKYPAWRADAAGAVLAAQ